MSAADPFAALNLPSAIHARALKLLSAIAQARTAADCTRAADRAEGFALGLETVRALNTASLEGLYLVFEQAATVRLVVLEQ
ncbi:hypothetical protein [Pseudomonas sp. BF-R-24]|uniref:hypothetical protein n=1 Tax=Pseudomonas sp. BF-R-24 TaxID=2832386 RepID=UPI001CBB4C04|nr:hypothetical protein [Pseudomonas sp. BF-R-24]